MCDMLCLLLLIVLQGFISSVDSCVDEKICKDLVSKYFPTVPKAVKCDIPLCLVAPAIYKCSVKSVLTMSDECPLTCNVCAKVDQKKLENILTTDTKFKSLLGDTGNTTDALQRYDIYTKNKNTVDSHNALYKKKQTLYTMVLNEFSVARKEELPPNSLPMDIKPDVITKEQVEKLIKNRSKRGVQSIDWTTYMKPVGNQGVCGGCWAFAMAGMIEGFLSIKGQSPEDKLSVQQLLDCDRDYHSKYKTSNRGCGGGYLQLAAEYFTKKGLASISDYPFIQSKDTNLLQCSGPIYPIAPRMEEFDSGYVTTNDSETTEALNQAMEKRLLLGPVAVGMAIHDDLYKYGGGIYDGNCGTSINHAVVLVGFTPEYWIVRNSWGSGWGEAGYMRMKRTIGDDPCKLTRYWAQAVEIGTWEKIITGGGANIIINETNNTTTSTPVNEDCCDSCCECEDDDDDEDDYYSTEEEYHPVKTTTTTSATSRLTSTTRLSSTTRPTPTSTRSPTTSPNLNQKVDIIGQFLCKNGIRFTINNRKIC